jgi:hypothetical protein
VITCVMVTDLMIWNPKKDPISMIILSKMMDSE